MRILELGKFYPPDRGGMETALRDACRGLRSRGHRVLALVATRRARPGLRRQGGVAVWSLASWGMIRGVPLCPRLLPSLRQSLRRFDPDVVHLHLPNPGMGLAWLLVGDDRPLIVTYHSDIVRQKWLARLWSPGLQRLLRQAARIVVTSQGLLEASPHLRPHRERCRVVPLGVDTDWFAQDDADRAAAWSQRVGPRFLLFVGRLVYYKGLDVLIDAMVDTPVRVVIVGEGPMGEAWRRRAQQLGLGDRLQFLGNVDPLDLRALYQASTALVLPSTAPSEAFGLVQLEAMASARAVVVARASAGVVSVHEEGRTALLVAPSDVAALREALVRLWNDPDLSEELGRAGRERVRQHFDQNQAAAGLEALVREVGAAREAGAGRRSSP